MSDYQTLQQDIANWIARDTLTSVIPTFIRLAEARHRRDLRLQAMMRRAQSVGNDSRFLALPADFLEMRRLRLTSSSPHVTLDQYTPEAFRVNESGGEPTAYCVHREIEFNSILGNNSQVEMVYYAPFDALAAPTDTNWLLTNAYDAYLYASLLAAEPYLRNDERIPVWASGYDGAVDMLRANDARGRVNRGGQRFSMAAVSTP